MPSRLPSLCLEYGADETNCATRLKICERGMSFHSHWQFSLGTQIGLGFSYHDANGEVVKVRAEGAVVECEPLSARCHQVTILFSEMSDALREAIQQFSALLQDFPSDADAEESAALAEFARRR